MIRATPHRRRDGRDTRWAQHRLSRRAELVEATLRAIRHHGVGVGMDEIAAEAGTSKTVIYRHFRDKAGLHQAVVEAVGALVLRDLTLVLSDLGSDPAWGSDPRGGLAALVDSYLRLVERDPEVYRFVVNRALVEGPITDDPVTGLTTRIADLMTAMFEAALREQGRDPAPAGTWGHALVGLVRAAVDQWIDAPMQITRAELVLRVSDLAWGGISAALAPVTTPPPTLAATPPLTQRPSLRSVRDDS